MFYSAFPISFSDYGIFLQRDIPAINLAAVGSFEKKVYHTHDDVPELLQEDTIQKFGETIEYLVRVLDELDYSKRDIEMGEDYFKISQTHFIPWYSTFVAHGLILFPALIVQIMFTCCTHCDNNQFNVKGIFVSLIPEFFYLMLLWFSLCAGYIVALILCYGIGMIPFYSLLFYCFLFTHFAISIHTNISNRLVSCNAE